MLNRLLFLAALVIFALEPCTLATAQVASPGAASTSDTEDQLEAIIVTAEKQTEDARKVPASITVISAAEIAERQILDIADLTRSVPNLSFSSQGGAGNQNIQLRGISSTAGSSTVSVYLDDVPLTVRNLDTQGQVEPAFFDIQRVEVLRGPQGTLYGASSEGGTIRYISNAVDLGRFSAEATSGVSWTTHGGVNYTAGGVINAPLVANELAIRAGISTIENSGYIDQYSADHPTQLLAKGVNGDQTTIARVALEWRPTDGWIVRPAVLYQLVKSDDLNVVDLGAAYQLSQQKRVREWGDDTLVVPSLTLDHDLQWADLTSASSYFYRDFNRQVDGTAYNSGYIGSLIDGASIVGVDGNLDGALVGNVASPVSYRIRTQQATQELRLASKPYTLGGARITWIGGLFHSHQKLDSRDFETAPGLNDTITSLYGPGFLTSPAFLQALSNPPVPVFPNDAVYLNNKLFTETQSAVFGEATYHVTQALRATAGLRYLHATTSLLRQGGYYFAIGSPPAISIDSSANPVTPKFALTYDLNEDTSIYLSASKGFRLGGPNRPLPSFCPRTPATYAADSLWSYETGAKALLLDGKLSVNGDVFYINWQSIQVDINLPCTFDYNTNAGTAQSYGSEFEVRYKPIRSVTLALSGGYTRATLTSDVPQLSITKGQSVPGVPEYSVDASARYGAPINDSVTGFASANWTYTGSSHGTVGIHDPDYNRPSYAVGGLTAGAEYRDWEISLFAKNLLNNLAIIQKPNLQTVNRGYVLTPRTVGVSATVRF